MKYQIDQSGKVEQTERHTVIACTNGKSITILLNKKDKRALQRLFRSIENERLFPYLTFAALLAILIVELDSKQQIIIDREYLSHEDLIEEKLNFYLEQMGVTTIPHITFGHVGKLSNAHNLAYRVAVGREKPTIIVGSKEVMGVILGTKKGRNRLTQDWIPGDRRLTNLKSNIPQKRWKIK